MTSSNGNSFRVTGPLCGEFTGPGEFPTQRPVTRKFDVFFDLCLNKRLSKQPWGWWFETLSWSLWRQRNVHSFWQFWARKYLLKLHYRVENTLMVHGENTFMVHGNRQQSTLTHWGRDKVNAIWQTTFSSAFSWMNMFEFWFKSSLKFVPKGPINNIPTLVQKMAWRRPGDKPLSEPMMASLLAHICVTRPQWVNERVVTYFLF